MKSTEGWLHTILLLLVVLILASTATAGVITDYKPELTAFTDFRGNLQLAIRTFNNDGVQYKLLINPVNLQASLCSARALKPVADFQGRQFSAIVETAAPPPFKLQNHGVKHAAAAVNGMFLTIDLCPSRRSLEKGMFENLSAIAEKTGRPVPVAICISGAWISSHQEDLQWLKELENRGGLSITWVNHSLSHFHDQTLPIEKNFMLAKGTDGRSEILNNEIAMLQAGITPSPFFRFPGLVSGEKLVRLLGELHLIPLGADAWLAKGEEPKNGSIILVHGNGNEPPGIARLMKLLRASPPPEFLPLHMSVTDPGNKKLDKPAPAGQR